MRLLSPTAALVLAVFLFGVTAVRPVLAQAVPEAGTQAGESEVAAPDFRSQGERPLAVQRRAPAPGAASLSAKPVIAEQPVAPEATRVLGFIATGIADAAGPQRVAATEPARQRKQVAGPAKPRQRPPARVVACDLELVLNRLHRRLRQSL